MANLSGSVIELSSYLEQRISQNSTEYAAVIIFVFVLFRYYFILNRILLYLC